MKLAVIFIGTGDYINFLPGWYESCEKNLVPNTDKEYFVFTDGELDGTPENMHVLKQGTYKTYITLERFKYILKAESDLANFDYVLFLDADTMVVDTVTEEDLFTDKKYIGVHHPCHFLGMPPHDKHPGAFGHALNLLLVSLVMMIPQFTSRVVYGVVKCLMSFL